MCVKCITWVAVVLVTVGALNWGLIGFFNYNLVTTLFGEGTRATTVVYDLIGLAAVYFGIFKILKAMGR